MSKQLAQCPYCAGCAISLNDRFEVVFNPDRLDHTPCLHLICAHGGCSQWERTPQGMSRVIGSTTIHWYHPDLAASDFSESLFPYMEMLAESGKGWEFAPAELFEIQAISEEGKALDPQGKEFTGWEADGWVVFACPPRPFLAAIRECQAKQSGIWQKAAGQQPASSTGSS